MSEILTSGVYKIENVTSGNIYIGSSSNIKKRLEAHVRMLQKGNHDNSHLQRSWDKYGEGAFQFAIVEECPCEKERLIALEQYYIELFRPQFNANPLAATMLGYKHSEETKAKFSASRKGKTLTPEHRIKIGLAGIGNKYGLGVKQTAETKARHSASMKGKNTWMLGKKHSEATKNKMASSHKGNKSRTGQHPSDEQRKKQSDAMKASSYKPVPPPWTEDRKRAASQRMMGNTYGKGHSPSEETRCKVSEAERGRIPWNKGLPKSEWASYRDRI